MNYYNCCKSRRRKPELSMLILLLLLLSPCLLLYAIASYCTGRLWPPCALLASMPVMESALTCSWPDRYSAGPQCAWPVNASLPSLLVSLPPRPNCRGGYAARWPPGGAVSTQWRQGLLSASRGEPRANRARPRHRRPRRLRRRRRPCRGRVMRWEALRDLRLAAHIPWGP